MSINKNSHRAQHDEDIIDTEIDENEEIARVVAAKPITGQQETEQAAPPEPEVPVDDQRYVKFGLVFLLITLGTFSLWAGFAPLSSALLSSGEVVVNSYRKSIQHYEGGIVQTIYVSNGDTVAAGDPLMQLETTQAGAQRSSNQKRLLTAKAELERLLSEQTFERNLSFSPELKAQAEKDADVSEVLKQQMQLHKARISAFLQEQSALASRKEQIQQQMVGFEQQRAILKLQIVSLKEEEKAFATLFEEGLGDGQRARELNRSTLSTQNEVARMESELARLKIQITETDLQIASRKQDFLKEVGERIKQVQSDYYNFQEGLQISADRVERSTIRAPEAGIVVDMQVHTVGSVAPPGKTLLDLVPEQDTYVVEAKLMTQDINEVYIGQKADIRFSAFSAKTTMVIEGEVINVSADRLLNKKDNSPYYLARIRVTDSGREEMGENMLLKPGMPAEVMILRGERTLFSYLLKPISDSFARSLKEK